MATKILDLAKPFQQLSTLLSFDASLLEIDELQKTFEEALLQHDFFFDYRDDHNVYQRGLQEYSILQEVLRRHPEFSEIWTDYILKKQAR